MKLSIRYVQSDLVDYFGQREIDKARPYVSRIRALRVENDHAVAALVPGRNGALYEQSILFEDGYPVRSWCSCPVGGGCKHVVAVLLSLLESAPDKDEHGERQAEDVVSWLEDLKRLVADAAEKPAGKARVTHRLFYDLKPMDDAGLALIVFKGRVRANGEPAAGANALSPWGNVERACLEPPSFVSPEDLPILRLIRSLGPSPWNNAWPLPPGDGDLILEKVIATGRLRLGSETPVKARLGDERPGELQWLEDEAGGFRLGVRTRPESYDVHLLQELWYVDVGRREIGRVRLASPLSPNALRSLLSAPAIPQALLPSAAGVLASMLPNVATPPDVVPPTVIEDPMTPCLVLSEQMVQQPLFWGSYSYNTDRVEVARPCFQYGALTVPIDDAATLRRGPDGALVEVRRDRQAEQAALGRLAATGLKELPVDQDVLHGFSLRVLPFYERPTASSGLFALESPDDWPAFMAAELERLREEGWEVRIDPDFRHHVLTPDAWLAEVQDDQDGWFSLDMGVIVEGERVPLAPMLYQLFRSDDRWLKKSRVDRIRNDEAILLHMADGRRLSVPAERIKPLARTLIDLFDQPPGETLRLSRYDASRLDALDRGGDWALQGGERLKDLARVLGSRGNLKPLDPPETFEAALRPYQRQGLAWLQFLGEHDLGGILADDMGLGKTAQTLAHLATEKAAGRLDKPALVILPTSLVFNWKREAERFVPSLRVLSLHGADRAARFGQIAEHEVVLSTYPLLRRDRDTLVEHDWSWLILDEAQVVKNVQSRTAQIIREFKAERRLCLTGTPMENHLGELWAQMDFLLPGFLGDHRQFQRAFRRPIERDGDQTRARLLASRIAPFILRRAKEDVASELPPKTEIIRTVELTGRQRDLYETVRSAMDERIRQAINEKGFARSQIVILDALLKLRQVCCHPGLLKLKAARGVKETAKLELLMDMLPELVDEGRRILIFSSFTSMLAEIAGRLARHKIEHATLTGDTRDREGVIRRFQDGEVPVFLISLKAGGVGLNLTRADTVIHYDPWWNPAAENQATDRAHRIGQTSQVFVYKLIAADSIEERILALQARKAALARGVLSEDGAALSKFDEKDIRALLEPMPD